MSEQSKILHPDLSYRVTGLCFKVHRELGRFCSERQYSDAVELLLKRNGISYEREFEVVDFKLDSPRGNRVDFFIDNKIIIDVKAKKFITKDDYFQMQRYLHCSGLQLGLIINFRSTYLKPKRVLNIRTYSDNSDVPRRRDSYHSDR